MPEKMQAAALLLVCLAVFGAVFVVLQPKEP
jgi:hypothetical protein